MKEHQTESSSRLVRFDVEGKTDLKRSLEDAVHKLQPRLTLTSVARNNGLRTIF